MNPRFPMRHIDRVTGADPVSPGVLDSKSD